MGMEAESMKKRMVMCRFSACIDKRLSKTCIVHLLIPFHRAFIKRGFGGRGTPAAMKKRMVVFADLRQYYISIITEFLNYSVLSPSVTVISID